MTNSRPTTTDIVRNRSVLFISRKWPPAIGGMETYSVRLTAELAKLIPGSRIQRIAAAGHLTNAEQPEVFNNAIESFLSGLDK